MFIVDTLAQVIPAALIVYLAWKIVQLFLWQRKFQREHAAIADNIAETQQRIDRIIACCKERGIGEATAKVLSEGDELSQRLGAAVVKYVGSSICRITAPEKFDHAAYQARVNDLLTLADEWLENPSSHFPDPINGDYCGDHRPSQY